MRELPHTRSCFVCGEFNSKGLRLRFHTDGAKVTTRFVADPSHCGFMHTVHGGIISTVMDELMAWVCIVHLKRFAFAAELNVRFLHPLKPGEEVIVDGWVTADKRGRIIETTCEMKGLDGILIARGTGKYMPVANPVEKTMAEDLIGGTEGILA
jgi:acyl-coenzyme A thioesterase PaaI-like protein